MITVLFFAALKQKVGTDSRSVAVDGEISVSELVSRMELTLPGLRQSLNDTRSQVAVNREFADMDAKVKDGDEVAFIPPMSGGAQPALVRLQPENFSIEDDVKRVTEGHPDVGAVVSFLGTVRDVARGRAVSQIDFESYPEMALAKLEEIRRIALERFEIIECLVVHRYGLLDVGDNIVHIAVAAAHRKEAFAACEWAIDKLKQITPIWKREITPEGDFWVEEHP